MCLLLAELYAGNEGVRWEGVLLCPGLHERTS